MSRMMPENRGYIYILECLGGVWKFGRTNSPRERLRSYRRETRQKEFRCSENSLFSFLWSCAESDVADVERLVLMELRAKFLQVRKEGFILERQIDLAEFVSAVYETCSIFHIQRADPEMFNPSIPPDREPRGINFSYAPNEWVSLKKIQRCGYDDWEDNDDWGVYTPHGTRIWGTSKQVDFWKNFIGPVMPKDDELRAREIKKDAYGNHCTLDLSFFECSAENERFLDGSRDLEPDERFVVLHSTIGSYPREFSARALKKSRWID